MYHFGVQLPHSISLRVRCEPQRLTKLPQRPPLFRISNDERTVFNVASGIAFMTYSISI